MEGDDHEAKKTLAGQTSIDSVERVGKFNPLRTRPVKVKFREKKDVDHLFKNRKELPGVYLLTRNTVDPLKKKEDCYSQC